MRTAAADARAVQMWDHAWLDLHLDHLELGIRAPAVDQDDAETPRPLLQDDIVRPPL